MCVTVKLCFICNVMILQVLLIVLKRSSRDRDSRKSQRKPYKYWDIAPVGYENMTPMEYKALQGDYFFIYYGKMNIKNSNTITKS